MVALPLLEVPSAENPTADRPLAHHHNASAGRSRCRRQCRLVRPPSGHTTRGRTYILLFTDRFSRRADMFPVTAAEFTAEGTANILENQYIPL